MSFYGQNMHSGIIMRWDWKNEESSRGLQYFVLVYELTEASAPPKSASNEGPLKMSALWPRFPNAVEVEIPKSSLRFAPMSGATDAGRGANGSKSAKGSALDARAGKAGLFAPLGAGGRGGALDFFDFVFDVLLLLEKSVSLALSWAGLLAGRGGAERLDFGAKASTPNGSEDWERETWGLFTSNQFVNNECRVYFCAYTWHCSCF